MGGGNATWQKTMCEGEGREEKKEGNNRSRQLEKKNVITPTNRSHHASSQAIKAFTTEIIVVRIYQHVMRTVTNTIRLFFLLN